MGVERLAALLMLGQAALFAAETAAIHAMGPQASIMQLAFLRGLAGAVLAVLLAREGLGCLLRTRQLALQLARGGISLLYLWVMLYVFSQLPFADATAISYTQVAYIPLFAAVILGEPVGRSCWLAAGLGVAGALLVAKPAFAGWDGVYAVAFLGAGLNGLSFVLGRYLQRDDSVSTTLFYSSLVPAVGNAPMLGLAELPAPEIALWLPGVLICGPLGVYLGIVAVRHADAASLGPYTLLGLVLAVVAGAIAFGEAPDSFGAVGAVVILASCIMASGIGIEGAWLSHRLRGQVTPRPTTKPAFRGVR